MKPGYKQTEIGVIPEDWDIGALKEAFPKLDAGVSVNSDESAYSDYFVLKTSAVRNGVVNAKEAKPVVRADYPRLKCPVKKGSIIISRMNTPAMVGECGFCVEEASNTFLPDRLWQVEPTASDYDFRWLNYLLNTEKFSAAIRATATGTSNSMKNIAKDRLLEISIPKPALPEQQRIAEALSDMDELIASLEKLIAKKQAIKQGVMQELLTGKRRLPGFRGEWKSELFGDLFEICPNNAYTRDQFALGGKIKNIHYGDILTIFGAYLDGSSESIPTLEKSLEKKKYAEKSFVQDGDIIIADTAEDLTVGKAVEIINVCGKMLSGQHTFLCRPIIKFAPKYLGYYLNSADFHDQVVPYVTGTKVSSINKSSLCSLTVKYPDIPEQRAIAEILSDMDKAILALEERLVKAQQVKYGMMQQLLTGKIRLV